MNGVEQETYTKLVPSPLPETQPYWDGLNEGNLKVQKCGSCGRLRHYPRPVCDKCHSMDVDWATMTGNGKVHTWTITHHAFHPGFKTELPYVLVTVDLDEGVGMQAQLDAPADTKLEVGQAVEVRFARVKDDLTLPFFVLAAK